MRSSLTIHLIRQARSTSALPENLCSFSIDGIKELDRKHFYSNAILFPNVSAITHSSRSEINIPT